MKTIIALLVIVVLAVGCTALGAKTKIGDINANQSAYVGKEVTVSGVVTDSLKIGRISGYVVEDPTGSIKVSSKALPAEGTNVTVKGTVAHDSLFGYYILTDN